MAFRGTPAYQKAILRLNREERGILDTLLIDQEFAETEGRKTLALARMGTEKELGEKRLAFRGEEAGARLALRETGMKATTGMRRENIEQRRTLGLARLGSRAERFQRERAFYESQLPTQKFLGWANVLAGGLTGYAGMRAGFAQAERDREMMEWFRKRG